MKMFGVFIIIFLVQFDHSLLWSVTPHDAKYKNEYIVHALGEFKNNKHVAQKYVCSSICSLVQYICYSS